MKTYLQVAVLYLIGLGLIFLLNYDEPNSVWGVFLTSFISVPFYLFLLIKGDYRHNVPLLLYVSMSFVRISIVGLYVAYIFSNGSYLELSPVFSNGYDSIYFGALVLVVGDLVFVTTCLVFWDRVYRKRVADSPIKAANNNDLILKNGVTLLVLAILFKVCNQIVNLKGFSCGFIYLVEHSGPSGLLLLVIYGLLNRKLPRSVSVFVLVYLAVEMTALLNAYYKQKTITYLMPLFYLAYATIVREQNKTRRILNTCMYGGLGFIVIMVLFGYSKLFREWVENADSLPGYSAKMEFLSDAIASSIPFTESFNEKNRLPNNGIWAVFSRCDLYTISAWVYNDVANFGYKRDMIEGFIHSVTPRIFFPDKGTVSFGRQFSVELGSAEDFDSAMTGTAIGMFPAYYRNYGWFGVLFGTCISAVLYSILVHYSSGRYLYNPVMTIMYFTLIVESLTWFEGAFLGEMECFAFMFIVFIPVSLVYERAVLRRGLFTRPYLG